MKLQKWKQVINYREQNEAGQAHTAKVSSSYNGSDELKHCIPRCEFTLSSQIWSLLKEEVGAVALR